MADERMWIKRSTLESIGNAVRTKKGTTDAIPVPELESEILSIESGGSSGESCVDLSGRYTIGGNGRYYNGNYYDHPYNYTIKEAVSGLVNGTPFSFIEVEGVGGANCPDQPFATIRFNGSSGNVVASYISYELENTGVEITQASGRVTALFYSVLMGF